MEVHVTDELEHGGLSVGGHGDDALGISVPGLESFLQVVAQSVGSSAVDLLVDAQDELLGLRCADVDKVNQKGLVGLVAAAGPSVCTDAVPLEAIHDELDLEEDVSKRIKVKEGERLHLALDESFSVLEDAVKGLNGGRLVGGVELRTKPSEGSTADNREGDVGVKNHSQKSVVCLVLLGVAHLFRDGIE